MSKPRFAISVPNPMSIPFYCNIGTLDTVSGRCTKYRYVLVLCINLVAVWLVYTSSVPVWLVCSDTNRSILVWSVCIGGTDWYGQYAPALYGKPWYGLMLLMQYYCWPFKIVICNLQIVRNQKSSILRSLPYASSGQRIVTIYLGT